MTTALVLNGAKVYIASRKLQIGQETANELNALSKKGGSCVPLKADLVSKAQVDKLVSELQALEPHGIHILINNSGMSWGDKLSDFNEKKGWDQLLSLNVKAPFYLTAGLLPLLAKGARGNRDPARVINISSTSSVQPMVETPLGEEGSGIWSCKPSFYMRYTEII
jgi:NAD(P)-dependent dehydrogenase (short-subunit alcohol dehydrogenase family)